MRVKKNMQKHTKTSHRIDDLPRGLRKHLRLFEAYQKNFPPCIYFLCKHGQISYIGLSVNLCHRIREHIKTKLFDMAFYLPCPKDKLPTVEKYMIKKYQPYLNGKTQPREWFRIEDVGTHQIYPVLQSLIWSRTVAM
jgi:hypothetical protein